MADLHSRLRSTITERLETARRANEEALPWLYERGPYGPRVVVGDNAWEHNCEPALWQCEDELDGCPDMARGWAAEGRHIATHDPASMISLYEGLLRIVDECEGKRYSDPADLVCEQVLSILADSLGVDTGGTDA